MRFNLGTQAYLKNGTVTHPDGTVEERAICGRQHGDWVHTSKKR